ncbi:MAG: hypothetical protein MJA29_10715, partial [Candidatus Omnitrophica bacterium]|nr:hypothetical protein [Candidatus Omnitrophota bacterium]
SFLTVIVTVGLVYLAIKVFGLKIKFGRMNGHLAKIMMGSMLKLPIFQYLMKICRCPYPFRPKKHLPGFSTKFMIGFMWVCSVTHRPIS